MTTKKSSSLIKTTFASKIVMTCFRTAKKVILGESDMVYSMVDRMKNLSTLLEPQGLGVNSCVYFVYVICSKEICKVG